VGLRGELKVAIPSLVELLAHSDWFIRSTATSALETLATDGE
jgi:HEAT repeat protein